MVQCLLENSRQFPVYVINDGHSYVINILTFWSKGKHILILLTVDYITLHYMWWIGSECFATSNCLLGVVFLRTRIVALSIQETHVCPVRRASSVFHLSGTASRHPYLYVQSTSYALYVYTCMLFRLKQLVNVNKTTENEMHNIT